MKVVLVNTFYSPNLVGGAERSVQSLAESLVAAGTEVVVVTLGPRDSTTTINGVRVYYVKLRNIYSPFDQVAPSSPTKAVWHAIDTYNGPMARKVYQIIQAERPDLVHTNNLSGFSVSLWKQVKRLGIPIVHTLRDFYLLCPRSGMYRNGHNCISPCWDCQVLSSARKKASRLVDAVIGISHFMLDRHTAANCFSGSRIKRVIHNGYRPAQLCMPAAEPLELRPVRFGFLGRLSPEKGLDLLLASLVDLPRGGWELWVAGKGQDDYVQTLRQRYESPRIRFLGATEPEQFFSKIDLLVTPSLWNEPLGRVILEAYSYGVPVIGSNRGGIPEVIWEGETGFIFDPDHPETLTTLLEWLLQEKDRLGRMQQSCLERSLTFDPERICEQYLEVYESMVAEAESELG